MPRQDWYYCTHCAMDRRFEYIHRRHRAFKDGHEDWHCITCGGCEYQPMRKRPALAQQLLPNDAGSAAMTHQTAPRR